MSPVCRCHSAYTARTPQRHTIVIRVLLRGRVKGACVAGCVTPYVKDSAWTSGWVRSALASNRRFAFGKTGEVRRWRRDALCEGQRLDLGVGAKRPPVKPEVCLRQNGGGPGAVRRCRTCLGLRVEFNVGGVRDGIGERVGCYLHYASNAHADFFHDQFVCSRILSHQNATTDSTDNFVFQEVSLADLPPSVR